MWLALGIPFFYQINSTQFVLLSQKSRNVADINCQTQDTEKGDGECLPAHWASETGDGEYEPQLRQSIFKNLSSQIYR